MAGAGYKLFNTGDVLLASEVNTYLMQQTVMVFANASARTTALSGVLAEGMVSYLQDTNVVEIYNGSAWASLDDPNAIQNTIVDAKGDLISATADNTPARLASSGVNGNVLTVDTSTSTGLKWAAPASFGTLTSYTPTLTGITIGNGTFSDVGYSESGDAVWYYGMFSYGSTSSSSGAGVQISLPVNADPTASNIAGRSPAWNFAGVADTSTGYYYPLMAAAQNATPSTKLDLYRLLANGTNLYNDATPMDGNTNPIALGTGDTIWWNFIYKKA